MDVILIAILAYILMIGFLTVAHELGHYSVARWAGLPATDFSIGFGKPIASWTDSRGTKWSFAPFLLGGYVKFPTKDNRSGLDLLPYWHKMAVVFAGPATNVVLAFVLFWTVLSINGVNVTPAKIERVEPNSPAAEAGLQPGDLVTRLNNRSIKTSNELIINLYRHPGQRVELELQRDDRTITTTAYLGTREMHDNSGNKNRTGYLGIEMPPPIFEAPGPIATLGHAGRLFNNILDTNVHILTQISTGERPIDELSGPIRIANTAGETIRRGLVPFLFLSALASLSIGIINLLPIPGLDGSHMIRYTIEALTKKRMSIRTTKIFYGTGAVCIALLMVLLVTNDVIVMFNRN